MQRNNLLFAGAPRQVRVYHFSDNGAGSDERNLDDEVVKILGLEPWKGCHLSTGLDLEHADGVALLQRLINQRIVLWKLSEVDFLTPMVLYKAETILEHRHHAQAEKVYLDDTHVSAVFLIPLDNDAIRHRGRLQWHNSVERALTHDHAPGMLSQVTRKVLQRHREIEEGAYLWVVDVKACFFELHCSGVIRVFPTPHRRQCCDLPDHLLIESEHLTRFSYCKLAAIRD